MHKWALGGPHSACTRADNAMRRPNKLNFDQEKEVCKLYTDGMSGYNISKLYSISVACVYDTLRKHSVYIRDKSTAGRRLPPDESVFDIITPESAYWIGFLMADGNIKKDKQGSNVVCVGVAVKDSEHIYKFKKFLKSGHKVQVRKTDGFVSLEVKSDKLPNRLGEFGVIENKSLIAEVKGGLEFNSDFWRGVTDGDGCLVWDGKQIRVQLCGSMWLMNQFSSFIDTIVFNKTNVRRRKKGKEWFDTTINGSNAVMVIEKLYGDSVDIIKNKNILGSGYFNFIPAQVKEIRKLKGVLSQKKIASIYGVSIGSIDGVLNNTSYKWVS